MFLCKGPSLVTGVLAHGDSLDQIEVQNAATAVDRGGRQGRLAQGS